MKLKELKAKVLEYQYFEDTSIIDVAVASIVSNRLQIGEPVWLVIIGASSGGKSQILRPIAMADSGFIHRVDDLTENTFLSGIKAKEGEQVSLLLRIGGHGIIVISDMTVIMSKSAETRGSILSQFRMIYDGEMIKHSGSSKKPIRWPASAGKGYIGIVAGSTPSIYSSFEEVSDMGERFVYFRMKEYDPIKATELALTRKVNGQKLDQVLSEHYGNYIKEVTKFCEDKKDVIAELPDSVKNRIKEVASFAERVRTPVKYNYNEKLISRIPVPAMPMRVALQLQSIAQGVAALRLHDTGTCDFSEYDLSILDWVGYSLANEEKRACLKMLASVSFGQSLKTGVIADMMGLDTDIAKNILQNLSAVGVLERRADNQSLIWKFKKEADYNIVRRIEHIQGEIDFEDRDHTAEETVETDDF